MRTGGLSSWYVKPVFGKDFKMFQITKNTFIFCALTFNIFSGVLSAGHDQQAVECLIESQIAKALNCYGSSHFIH
jgi:hypothetical protein